MPDPSPADLSAADLQTAGPGPARTALVTGAGRGIGRLLALGLGQAGLAVGLLGRSREPLEQVADELAGQGAVAAVATADVRDWGEVEAAVASVQEVLGGVDLLVNNAGVIDPVEVPIWQADPDAWWHVIETDLRGPFHCVRAVVPGMIARGGGRVVDLNSNAGAEDRAIYSAYCAAKAGLFRIGGNLHLAGFTAGLRSFEVSPGHIRTDMTASMPLHAARTQWVPPEELLALILAIARGELDAWSGCFFRAGMDTPEALCAALEAGGPGGGNARPAPGARRLAVTPYGLQDPLAASS